METRNIDENLINQAAIRVANNYQLDIERVRNVLVKLEKNDDSRVVASDLTELDIAILSTGPPFAQKVLEIFEQEELEKVMMRNLVCRFLMSPFTSLHTHNALADHLESFLGYLERNGNHLIETGYPQSQYQKSYWLDRYLTGLYWVKFPANDPYLSYSISQWNEGKKSLIGFNLPVEGDEVALDPYTWCVETPTLRPIHDPIPIPDPLYEYTFKGGINKTAEFDQRINYSEAPFLPDLKPADGVRLEKMRTKIFQVKIGVLQRLREGLRNAGREGEGRRMREDCLAHITRGLNSDEIEFLTDIDDSYRHRHLRGTLLYSLREGKAIERHGLLSDLLEIIGHCTKEIRIGTMHVTAQRISETVPPIPLHSYYQTWTQPWHQKLDEALDGFQELYQRELVFWEDNKEIFESRIGNFKLEGTVVELRAALYYYRENHDRTQKASSRINASNSDNPRGYIFKRVPPGWFVQFADDGFPMRDLQGMLYIQLLLARKNVGFQVDELWDIVHQKIFNNPVSKSHSELGDEILGKMGLPTNHKIIKDPGINRTIKDLNKRWRELEDRLSYAEEIKDYSQIQTIKVEQAEINREKNYLIDRNGKPRDISGYENKRKGIIKDINYCRNLIMKDHPAFGQHLKDSIITKVPFRYSPKEPIDWILS